MLELKGEGNFVLPLLGRPQTPRALAGAIAKLIEWREDYRRKMVYILKEDLERLSLALEVNDEALVQFFNARVRATLALI